MLIQFIIDDPFIDDEERNVALPLLSMASIFFLFSLFCPSMNVSRTKLKTSPTLHFEERNLQKMDFHSSLKEKQEADRM